MSQNSLQYQASETLFQPFTSFFIEAEKNTWGRKENVKYNNKCAAPTTRSIALYLYISANRSTICTKNFIHALRIVSKNSGDLHHTRTKRKQDIRISHNAQSQASIQLRLRFGVNLNFQNSSKDLYGKKDFAVYYCGHKLNKIYYLTFATQDIFPCGLSRDKSCFRKRAPLVIILFSSRDHCPLSRKPRKLLRACKAIFSSLCLKNRKVYIPQTS